MITAKEIQKEFLEDYCNIITNDQKKTLNAIGCNLFPPEQLLTFFPNNKIIHNNKIISLCEKYKLKFTTIENYIGIIPSKNIDDINQFINKHTYYIKKKSILLSREAREKEEYFPLQYKWCIVAPEKYIVTQEIRNEIDKTGDDPIIIAMITEDYWYHQYRHNWGVVVTAWGDEIDNPINVNPNNN